MGRSALVELCVQAHTRALQFRNIDGLVNTKEFERFFESDPKLAKKLVKDGKLVELQRSLIKNKFTVSDLRDACRKFGIKNYSRLTKEEMENVPDIQRSLFGNESRNTDRSQG